MDEGPIKSLTCLLQKQSNTSAMWISFNGNLQLSGCTDCCMRWYLTIDDKECSDPAPLEAVIYSLSLDRLRVHRGSTIAGVCGGTSDGPLAPGEHRVTLNVGRCEGFNRTFDAYTGYDTVPTLSTREMPKGNEVCRQHTL